VIAHFLTWFRRTPPISIDESRLRHIFRAADGHFPTDTTANRRLLLFVAGNPANRLGEDRFGAVWAAQTMRDGSQVWVQIWNGRIINGGVNPVPRIFEFSTGLSAAREQGSEP
jgi:hypothetical protein